MNDEKLEKKEFEDHPMRYCDVTSAKEHSIRIDLDLVLSRYFFTTSLASSRGITSYFYSTTSVISLCYFFFLFFF